jgi:hypothetical protein
MYVGLGGQGSHQQPINSLLACLPPVAARLPACLPAENKEYDLLTASNFQRWVISCYFSLTTMVTIGALVWQPFAASQAACRLAAHLPVAAVPHHHH